MPRFAARSVQGVTNADPIPMSGRTAAEIPERGLAMKCPIDGSDLVMTERQGIEIDYCPKCRGVWLDRGELDKIIDRSATASPQEASSFIPPQPQPAAPSYRPSYQPQYDPRHQRHHKRKSFLGDLFDFD
jgi:Zn-finger nucleic acid-binding protein